jgi:hypothetical protein
LDVLVVLSVTRRLLTFAVAFVASTVAFTVALVEFSVEDP